MEYWQAVGLSEPRNDLLDRRPCTKLQCGCVVAHETQCNGTRYAEYCVYECELHKSPYAFFAPRRF